MGWQRVGHDFITSVSLLEKPAYILMYMMTLILSKNLLEVREECKRKYSALAHEDKTPGHNSLVAVASC